MLCKICVTVGCYVIFFFNDTATTEIYTLSLHDALPISIQFMAGCGHDHRCFRATHALQRSEEHTSELQSRQYLVCRLLLEKKETHDDTPKAHTTLRQTTRAGYGSVRR